MQITKVDFSAGGEGITALYIDDKLYRYGDYYHDKINDWIDGFVRGVKHAKVRVKYKSVALPSSNEWIEKTWEGGEAPPKKYDDLFK